MSYKRAPAHRPTDTTQHPHPLHHTDAWTDNGVVVLKHTTEVGDGVTVVFYSIYMHLSQVSLAATPGQAVYRRDSVQIAKRSELHTFKVMLAYWVVKHRFAWLEKSRCCWKNCKCKLNTSLPFIHLALLARLL